MQKPAAIDVHFHAARALLDMKGVGYVLQSVSRAWAR